MRTAHANWGMAYSETFRELARNATDRALRDRENPSVAHCKLKDGSCITYTPHAIEAVLLSVMGLEAGVNEMGVWIRKGFDTGSTPLPEDFEKRRLRGKWDAIAFALAATTLDRGSSPWQEGFSTLLPLRDQLVHFKWLAGTQPPRLMRALESRRLVLPALPGTYWVDAALTDRTASWATRTMDEMFAVLATIVGPNRTNWAWR